MTTIVPEIDPSRPATVDPDKIIQAILQEGVTNSFGSPTLWRKIAARGRERGITLPSLRRVLMAGAPVPPALFREVQALLPQGTAFSPYGATESLPLCSISAAEVLSETAAATAKGAGTCVGRPVPEIEIKIIAITDTPLAAFADARELPAGGIGEIIVRGPVVTRQYDGLPEATAAAKIADTQLSTHNSQPTSFWHRMGDVGYLDDQGRLWFCGRKAERVETRDGPLYTEQIEPWFNTHPSVRRTALIGLGPVGSQVPALVVEPLTKASISTASLRRKLIRELRDFAAKQPATSRIRHFYLHPSFPVDVRHNAKIHRLALARWASTQPAYESSARR